MEALKCEACGGELTLDAGQDLYRCEYCGSKFPRKAAGGEAPAMAAPGAAGILPADRLIQNGSTMLGLGDYGRAREIFERAAEYYPEDYRGWWHIFLCDTKRLTAIRPDKDALYKTKELEFALRTAPGDVQPDLLHQYRAFAGQCIKSGCEREVATLANECRKLEGDILAQEKAAAACLKKGKLVIPHKKLVMVASVAAMIPVLPTLANPNLWLMLTIPLGLFGAFVFAATKRSDSNAQNVKLAQAYTSERDRLALLRKGKQEYLEKLNQYSRDLPATMERLSIADILKQQKYIA